MGRLLAPSPAMLPHCENRPFVVMSLRGTWWE
jgi:hypothetical protein